MPESKAILLPTNVRPEKYTLTLEPDLTAFTFNGSETIDIEVLEATDTITMNSVEIEVNSCNIVAADGGEASAGRISYDEKQESVSFHFDGEIPVGKATISLEFVGELNDRLRGFYRSQYMDIDGNERYMATTQFESTDARRAFPCWDEPSLKARIELTLVVPAELTAVSNMPVVSEENVGPDKRSVRFGESPIMSTYLLVIVVGDLSLIEQEAPNGTLVRIFTMRGRQEQGRFALETSIRLLGYFNEYFGIPYPLPKLDHLAIPDFAAGAMENWGAITYRENALLVDPDNTSAGTRQTVAGIIAHEMAHMWFGDLVTMSWWNDLWLNESFASWMGDKATDALFPEWEIWTQFVSADTNRGLSLDGLRSSHPIEQEVNDPAGIEQLFDAISYSKGAAVLRMLESYIGADDFRAGLHDYLTKHKYSNAKTVDLWNALGAASGQPVADVMNTWTSQMGYPVLETSIDRDATGIEVSLSQRRFVYEDILSDQIDGSLWRVPVRVDTADHPEASAELVSERTGTIKVRLGRSGPSVWVKVNPEQTGFYRVKYDSEDLQLLIGPIQNGSLPAPDRLGIQNDAYALSRAGMISATDFLAIAEAYKNETSAPVCADLASNLDGVDVLLGGETFFSSYQAFARRIYQPIGARIGWDARPGEGHLDALLRSTALSTLGQYEDEDTLREASVRFQSYLRDPSDLSPDLRGMVFSLAAKRGDRSTYDAMWEARGNSSLQEEQVRLLGGVSSFEQPELLQETLERSLTDELRVHETINAVVMVAGSRQGRELAWDFMKANWDEFDRRYGEGGFALMRLVGVTSGFTTPERREDVERFFTDHPVPGAERSVRQSLERISLNIAWLDKNRDELARWFVG